MVPPARLELARLAAADFESATSTDFVTGAEVCRWQGEKIMAWGLPGRARARLPQFLACARVREEFAHGPAGRTGLQDTGRRHRRHAAGPIAAPARRRQR